MIFLITFIFFAATFAIIYLGIKTEKAAAQRRWKARKDLSPAGRKLLRKAGYPV